MLLTCTWFCLEKIMYYFFPSIRTYAFTRLLLLQLHPPLTDEIILMKVRDWNVPQAPPQAGEDTE